MTDYNIGPGAIQEPGTEGGPGFILSKTEWIAVQTYVTDALALPVTADELRGSLGPGAPSDISNFLPLLAAYQGINSHCQVWRNTTFPKTVELASKIYEYGTAKAPVYYPAMLEEAKTLSSDPGNQNAKEALKAILDNLQVQATDYANQASAAEHEIKTFTDQTESDRVILVGPGGLYDKYNEEYGSKNKEVEKLVAEIKTLALELKVANDEYNYDVTVASTTPAYVWWFPLGTIAGAVVAGVYGDKAVKARERATALQGKIDTLSDQLTLAANLMDAINLAIRGTEEIGRSLLAALPVVQKIRGVWGAIAADLTQIINLIDSDIRKVPPIIMRLGVEEAMRAWYDVAQVANQYRINAYVQQSGGLDFSMEAWRVKRYLASSRRTSRQQKIAA